MVNSFEEKVFGEGFFEELSLLYCGRRERNYAHTYPPHRADRYILTLVVEGEAELTFEGGEKIVLEKGCFYAMFPKSGAHYETRADTPWSIKWIVLSGERVGQYLSLLGLAPASPVLRPNAAGEIEAVLDRLFLLFNSFALADRLLCLSLVHRLFSLLAEHTPVTAARSRRMGEAVAYLEAHYREPLSVGMLADRSGYHPNYFIKRFRAEVGCTPWALLLRLRLRRARSLLTHSELSVGEIAHEVGFSDELYFSRAFRREYGLAPSAFRRSLSYPI